MKLKEKLAKEYGQFGQCCCGNSGCGGQAQADAHLAGFEKAKELLLEMEPWKERSWFEIPMRDLKNLGEEEVD